MGPRNQLPPNFQPLVVNVGAPVAHARLANALVKAMVLLMWPSARPAALTEQVTGRPCVPHLRAPANPLAAHPPSALLTPLCLPRPARRVAQVLAWGPRLAHAPISLAQMEDFQQWRGPGRHNMLQGARQGASCCCSSCAATCIA